MVYLVSLINDHIFSSYLFIREMEGKYDRLLFLTSQRGLGYEKRIERTLKITENSVRRIIISDIDLNNTRGELKKHQFSLDDQFIVHLSSESTIMAIGAFEFFSQFKQSSFYYIPPGENMIRNVLTSQKCPLAYRVNVWEYFTLHGLRFECKDSMIYPYIHTNQLYERFKKARYDIYKIPEMKNYDTLDSECDRQYYSGAWFEEYTYHRIKKEKGLKDDCIYTGVKIFRSETDTTNDNEIDLVYVIDNEVYIGECKVSLKGVPNCSGAKLLEQYLYKLAAISIDFGLNVRQFVFTLHAFKQFSFEKMYAVKRRMKILRLEGLIGRDDFEKATLLLIFPR